MPAVSQTISNGLAGTAVQWISKILKYRMDFNALDYFR